MTLRGINRRDALRAGLGAAAGMALYGCAGTQVAGTTDAKRAVQPALKATATALNERLLLVSGLGGNLVALRGEEGLLLVDSGAPGTGKALEAELARFAPGARVAMVINTHWHDAQSGGNDLFGAAGATLVAHAKAAQRMAVPQYLPWEDRYLPARAKVAVPTRIFHNGSREFSFGGERVEYGYLQQPHTDGDVYVWFKDSNVLLAGDAVAPVSDPLLCWYEGGWPGGRADSQAKLLQMGDANTRIIAGTGGVIGRAEVQAEHDSMVAMFDRVSEAMRKGMTTEDMQQARLLDGLPRTWADPDQALYDAHKGMWAHYNKLSHSIV